MKSIFIYFSPWTSTNCKNQVSSLCFSERRKSSTMSLRKQSFVETNENGSSELWFGADPRLRNDVSVPCQPCSFSHASIWAALWPSWINFPKQQYGKANMSSAFLFESINRQRDKSFLRPSAMPCNMFVPMLANAMVCSESQVWSRKSIVFEDKSRRAATRQRWKRSSSMNTNRSSLLTSFGSISGNSRNVSFRLFSHVSFAIWWKVTLTLKTINEIPSSLSRCHTRRTDLGDTLHVLALARWESRSLGKYPSISPRRLHPLGKQSGRSSRLTRTDRRSLSSDHVSKSGSDLPSVGLSIVLRCSSDLDEVPLVETKEREIRRHPTRERTINLGTLPDDDDSQHRSTLPSKRNSLISSSFTPSEIDPDGLDEWTAVAISEKDQTTRRSSSECVQWRISNEEIHRQR